MIADWWLPQNK